MAAYLRRFEAWVKGGLKDLPVVTIEDLKNEILQQAKANAFADRSETSTDDQTKTGIGTDAPESTTGTRPKPEPRTFWYFNRHQEKVDWGRAPSAKLMSCFMGD